MRSWSFFDFTGSIGSRKCKEYNTTIFQEVVNCIRSDIKVHSSWEDTQFNQCTTTINITLTHTQIYRVFSLVYLVKSFIHFAVKHFATSRIVQIHFTLKFASAFCRGRRRGLQGPVVPHRKYWLLTQIGGLSICSINPEVTIHQSCWLCYYHPSGPLARLEADYSRLLLWYTSSDK